MSCSIYTDMAWTIADLVKMMVSGFAALNPSDAGDAFIANQILAALTIRASLLNNKHLLIKIKKEKLL